MDRSEPAAEASSTSSSGQVAIKSKETVYDEYQSLFTLETAGKLLTECGMSVPAGKYERVLHIVAHVPEPIVRSFIQLQADRLLQQYNEGSLSSPSHVGMLKKMLRFLNRDNPTFRMPMLAIVKTRSAAKKPRTEGGEAEEDIHTDDDDDDDEEVVVVASEGEVRTSSSLPLPPSAPPPNMDKFKSGDHVTWMRGRDRLFGIVDHTVSLHLVRVNIATSVALKSMGPGSIYFVSDPVWDGYKMMGNVDARTLTVMTDTTKYAHLCL